MKAFYPIKIIAEWLNESCWVLSIQYTLTEYKLRSKWVNYLLDFGVAQRFARLNGKCLGHTRNNICRVTRKALPLTMIIGMGATSPLANSVRG